MHIRTALGAYDVQAIDTPADPGVDWTHRIAVEALEVLSMVATGGVMANGNWLYYNSEVYAPTELYPQALPVLSCQLQSRRFHYLGSPAKHSPSRHYT
jgi:hypothetical protein